MDFKKFFQAPLGYIVIGIISFLILVPVFKAAQYIDLPQPKYSSEEEAEQVNCWLGSNNCYRDSWEDGKRVCSGQCDSSDENCDETCETGCPTDSPKP